MQTKVKPLSISEVDHLSRFSEDQLGRQGSLGSFQKDLSNYIEFFWQENIEGYKETFSIQSKEHFYRNKSSFVKRICLDIFKEIGFKYIPSDLILNYFDFFLKNGGKTNARFDDHELHLADNLYVEVSARISQLREEVQ